MSSRAQLLTAFLRSAPVPVEIAGEAFYLRALNTGDMLTVQAYQRSRANNDGSPMVFVLSVCDEFGCRLFSDDDTELVADMVGGVVDQVADKVIEISHLARTPAGKAHSTPGTSLNSSSD